MHIRTLFLSLALLVGSTSLGGCLLFSPYASPVVKPLQKGEVEAAVGAGALPRFYADIQSDLGLEGGVHFSPVDRLMLGARLWSSTDAWEEEGAGIDGFGIDAAWLLDDPERTDRFRLAPAVHFQHNSNTTEYSGDFGHPGPGAVDSGTFTISGVGYGLGLHAWTPAIGDLHPVVGLTARRYTFGLGGEGSDGTEKSNVVTVGLHGGLGYELTENLGLSAEVVLLHESPEKTDRDDGVESRTILTPMIRAAWRF